MRKNVKKTLLLSGLTLSLLTGGAFLASTGTLQAESVSAAAASEKTTSKDLVKLLDPTGQANAHLLATNFRLKNIESNKYLNGSGDTLTLGSSATGSQAEWTGNYITSGHFQLVNTANHQLLSEPTSGQAGFSAVTADKTVKNVQWVLQSVPASRVNGKKMFISSKITQPTIT